MKAHPSMGLVVAGGLYQVFLSKMPRLLGQLGPLKASSFSVARRLVNSLHGGYAVSHYAAMEQCSLIWIAVPEDTLERVVRDLAAQMPVHRTMVVLCDMERASSWPNPLRVAGARMASVNVVGDAREGLLTGEGDPDTLRVLHRVFAQERRRFLELLPDTKASFFAGIEMATRLLLPWIDASMTCFRAAGLTRSQATELMESLSGRTARAYARSGRKAWNRRSDASLGKTRERDMEAIAAVSTLYAEGVRLSLAHFEQ
jgi:hypothetical protein